MFGLRKFDNLINFKNIIFESLAYCIIPNFEGNIFTKYNSKPIGLEYYTKRQEKINKEFTELPPIIDKQYSLVLDMDETLIHFFDVGIILFLYLLDRFNNWNIFSKTIYV